ncbi:hypothetical protein EPO05_01540 [Patescibacteria group bacterium]|nr:MAG: hypothetical protein EPO05_01540 [Patescibacteria group bacterium]
MENVKRILAAINIPVPAQAIYVSLLEKGRATARTLALRTGITRTSIYDQVKILRDKGLVTELSVEGKTFFEASDVRQLSALLDEQLEKLTVQKKFLSQNLSSLAQKTRSAQPKVRFFEGQEGVRQLLKDLLWYDDIALHIYWPYEQMLNFLGKEFLLWFSARRAAHGISIQTIWGARPKKVTKNIFIDDGPDVERRILESQQPSPMGYVIYENKVAFISSQKESFGFIVESTEFVALQQMQFDILWKAARKK